MKLFQEGEGKWEKHHAHKCKKVQLRRTVEGHAIKRDQMENYKRKKEK